MAIWCNPEFPALAVQEKEPEAYCRCLLWVGIDQLTTVDFLFQFQVSVILCL